MPQLRRYLSLTLFVGLGLCAREPASTGSTGSLIRPYLRLEHPVQRLAVSPRGLYLAFSQREPSLGEVLKVLEFKTRRIYEVSREQVGPAFTWAPEGVRLFYREQLRPKENAPIVSLLKAFDASLHTDVELRKILGPTSYVNLDPRDLRLRILTPDRLLVHALHYPGSRLAKWQSPEALEQGLWLVTQGGVLWSNRAGRELQRLADDHSQVESFAVSADGQALAWSTAAGLLYVSHSGQPPLPLGYGQHPSWHPHRKLLVYSGARLLGNVAVRFDLRLSDGKGKGQWLTQSQHSDELWPVWLTQDKEPTKLLFTLAQTSDLYVMECDDAKPE